MKTKSVIACLPVMLLGTGAGLLSPALFGFTTNRRPDLIWHHDNGQNACWYFPAPPGNLSLANSQFITTSTDPNWQMAGAGDFARNGQTDILWRNLTTGKTDCRYFVHRSPARDIDGDFIRLTSGSGIAETSFKDNAPPPTGARLSKFVRSNWSPAGAARTRT
ncbi:MAG: hypothetical protein HY043_02035 [Verrucomicrobia bacterium]|nr:hypothetical protein [Verrucomicrobiota bacterium]